MLCAARVAVALTVLVGCSAGPHDPSPPLGSDAGSATPAADALSHPPEGRLPTTAHPDSYRLELDVDPKADGFSGKATIALTLDAPTRSLWLHGRDLTIESASLSGASAPLATKAYPEHGILGVDLGAERAPGDYTLTIAYRGKYADGLVGVYKVEAGGESYVFTQFEALDARRAFPCFDEPSFKTPFDVSVVARSGDTVIGNTQIAEEKPTDAGKKRVQFRTTEKLPTYLVALAVGPFDIVEAAPIPASASRTTPIPLRGVAVKGQGRKLAYALAEAPNVILELEKYFGIAYPYDKLDLIAVPDFAAGAMENAGAVTFREVLLLVDPALGTETQRRDVTATMSHELSHQWFGDLVTMAWWDDLWLNEAFATWMGQRTVGKLHPGWETELETLAGMHGAMDSDSLSSARAIRQPIKSEDDIENAFDDLTYEKGGGLIGMFERYVGEDRFQAGVRRYLGKHRFGVATTDQFLADVFEGLPPELPAAFHGLLDHPGVPAISLSTCDPKKPGAITATVSRWLPLGSSADKNLVSSVPVCLKSAGGKETCKLLGPGVNEISLGATCPKWVFPNAGGAAYARWNPTRLELVEIMKDAWKELRPTEKMATADAIRAGYRAGTLDTEALFEALPKIANDPSRSVAFTLVEDLESVRDSIVDPAQRPALARKMDTIYGPLFKTAGWDAKKKNDTPVLRHDALEAATLVGRDPALRKEAARRAARWLGLGSPADKTALPPEIVEVALSIVVQEGDPEVWSALASLLAKTDDALARWQLLIAMMRTPDAALAGKARQMVLDGTIRSSEVFRAIATMMFVPEQGEATWQWFAKNVDALAARAPEGVSGYFPALAEHLCDDKREAEIRGLFNPRLDKFVGARRELENTIERLHVCSAIRRQQAEAANRFLGKPNP